MIGQNLFQNVITKKLYLFIRIIIYSFFLLQNVSQWFSSTPSQCSHVEAVVPASISLPFTTSSAGHLNLVISSLPTLPSGDSFVCVYANSTVVKAKPIQRGLQCPIPKSEVFSEYLSTASQDTNRDTVQVI